MVWRGYSLFLAFLILSLCENVVVNCHAAGSHLRSKAGLAVECVGGFRSELKIDFKPLERAGIRYRINDKLSTFSVYFKGGWFFRRAIIGDFRLFSGDGLLLGDAIRFHYPSHNSVNRHISLQAVPTLSTWNTQRGAFLCASGKGFSIYTAAFKKLGSYPDSSSPPATLASLSIEREKVKAGFGALLPWRNRMISRMESPVFFFNACSSRKQVLISGEFVAIHHRTFFSLSANAKSRVSFLMRLFKSPSGYSVGDWLKVFKHKGSDQGGILEVWLRRSLLHPSMILISSVTSEEKYTEKRGLVEASISGSERSEIRWKISLLAQSKAKFNYPGSYLRSSANEEYKRESIMRFKLRAKRGAFTHILSTSFFLDHTGKISGISINLRLKLQREPIDFILNVNSYAGGQRTLVIFRPGIGSFEKLSFIRGRNIDVSSRLTINLLPGLEIVAYCGRPWLKTNRIYAGLKLRL